MFSNDFDSGHDDVLNLNKSDDYKNFKQELDYFCVLLSKDQRDKIHYLVSIAYSIGLKQGMLDALDHSEKSISRLKKDILKDDLIAYAKKQFKEG